MDEFCGSPFWDMKLTWYTEDPELTPCFEKTALIWTPCLFLWVFLPLEICYLVKSRCKNVPWNFLNISKMMLTILLIIISILDISYTIYQSNNGIAVHTVDFVTPTVKLLSFALAAALLYFNRLQGMQTSGLLWQFYLYLAIMGIPQLRTEIRAFNQEVESDATDYIFYSYVIYYTDVCLIFILNCFPDAEPTYSFHKRTEKLHPEIRASFLSRIMFSWFFPLVWKGFRHPLEVKDLWDLNPIDSSQEVTPVFRKYWEKAVRKAEKKSSKGSGKKTGKRAKHQASILPILFKVFWPSVLFGAFIHILIDIVTFTSPQILKLLIDFINNRDYIWKGYLYATLLFVLPMVQTFLMAQYFDRMFRVGVRIRTALISTIYRKAMRMSNGARKESTVGEIVNLMSVDAQRFMDLMVTLNLLWSAPFQMALAIYFLYGALGISVVSGLTVMILLIPLNGVFASRLKMLQIKQMKFKDERVKLMNEVLCGIKVLKLYAWEPSFEERILGIRNKEMQILRTTAYLNAATVFLWSCAPFLVSLATFATYVLIDENNILDAKTTFFSLSLFNLLRLPLGMLPQLISQIIQAAVSVKRLNKFLNCEELNPDDVSHDPKEPDPVVIEDGNFSWGDDGPPTLKNINMRVKKGGLVAVVGSVGTGKSSLLSAILGEMEKVSGRVNTNGSVAYVPQQAWIKNATLRDNILFGGTAGMSQYYKIVEACALKSDFEMLPGGDQTEIGEKGINLSGGQKQRVSLARAAFSDADVFLLDDPLSAVDSHVGKHIFDNVIGPQGVLRKKTRVLVTHSITFLPEVDNIIVLNNGEISECGTFKELLKQKGAFAEFLLQHLQQVDVGDGDTDLEEIKAHLEGTVSAAAPEVQRELKKQLSRLSSQDDSRRSFSGSTGRLSMGSAEHINGLRRRTSSNPKDSAAPNEANVGKKLVEMEKVETGGVKKKVYLYYLKSVGLFASCATIILNIIFQGLSTGSGVWLSVWSGDDTNYTANSPEYAAARDMYLGVYGALGLGQVISLWLATLALYTGALSAARILHALMLSNILRTPVAFFDVTPAGRLLNRFAKDIDVLDNTLPMSLRGWFNCFLSVVGTIVIISYSTPIFMTVIVPLTLFYHFVQRFYVATSRQLRRLDSVTRSPVYSHFGESITGASSIRAYGMVDRFVKESEDKVDYNQICYHPIVAADRWSSIRLKVVGNFIVFFAALFAIIDRDSDAGLVGLSVSYALQVTQTLSWLVRTTSEVETNVVAVERVKEYTDIPQEAPWNNSADSVPAGWPENGEVQFVDYTVRYREGLELVLKGISFTVKGGEKVGIVGRTGAGKSSLTLGLFRIIEAASGKILIDGVDISKLGLHELRSNLTIIPQDPVLFAGSLRLNLDPFEKYSDAELWQALEHAHLKAFVEELSAGLQFMVTEGGENLSVGQRQLICLARALLRKTRVLVLDEATAAVDLETDDLIQTTIRQEFKECTVLTIAHRLNTVMDSDRVLVLDKGFVVEYESPEKLLELKNSVFYGMAKDAGLV